MKNYRLYLCHYEARDPFEIRPGVCFEHDEDPEVICSEEHMDAVLAQLNNLKSSVKVYQNGRLIYFELDEYVLAEEECDEDGEVIEFGGVFAWTEFEINVELQEDDEYVKTVGPYSTYREAQWEGESWAAEGDDRTWDIKFR